jgi:hypothetical protein
MLSPQNQRNRALQRAFKAPLLCRSWLPPVALPGTIASQTTHDAKFLSLNRWRKPSEVLSRNWRHNMLNANELHEERLYQSTR